MCPNCPLSSQKSHYCAAPVERLGFSAAQEGFVTNLRPRTSVPVGKGLVELLEQAWPRASRARRSRRPSGSSRSRFPRARRWGWPRSRPWYPTASVPAILHLCQQGGGRAGRGAGDRSAPDDRARGLACAGCASITRLPRVDSHRRHASAPDHADSGSAVVINACPSIASVSSRRPRRSTSSSLRHVVQQQQRRLAARLRRGRRVRKESTRAGQAAADPVKQNAGRRGRPTRSGSRPGADRVRCSHAPRPHRSYPPARPRAPRLVVARDRGRYDERRLPLEAELGCTSREVRCEQVDGAGAILHQLEPVPRELVIPASERGFSRCAAARTRPSNALRWARART